MFIGKRCNFRCCYANRLQSTKSSLLQANAHVSSAAFLQESWHDTPRLHSAFQAGRRYFLECFPRDVCQR